MIAVYKFGYFTTKNKRLFVYKLLLTFVKIGQNIIRIMSTPTKLKRNSFEERFQIIGKKIDQIENDCADDKLKVKKKTTLNNSFT